MKVLQVINNLQMGGAERFVCDMAETLRRRGVGTQILLLELTQRSLYDQLIANGFSAEVSTAASLYSPKQILKIRDAAKSSKADVVHSHLFPATLWTTLSLLGTGIPAIMTEHNTWNRRRHWRALKALDYPMYAGYATIVCNSDQTAEKLHDWLPHLTTHTEVILNGINLEQFPATKQTKISHEPMTVVTIGRLDTQKGLPVLIRAISLVPEIRLKIVGDGPLRPELESLVSSMRLGERVSFLGIRSNVADILGAADAYAQSSEWEGFGLAAVEAMSSGLPLIISDVPGLRDVAADAGLRFPPGNHVELAKHLARLSVDADLQQRLRKMSLARAKNFSIEKTTDEYLHVYRRVSRPESTFSSCSASAA